MKKALVPIVLACSCYAPLSLAQTAEDSFVSAPQSSETIPHVVNSTEGSSPPPATSSSPLNKEVLDQLSPAQKEKVMEAIHERWMALTAEEREEARMKIKEALLQMTPEQRIAILKSIKAQWEALTPEQQRSIQLQSQEYWQSLPIKERLWILERQKQSQQNKQ